MMLFKHIKFDHFRKTATNISSKNKYVCTLFNGNNRALHFQIVLSFPYVQ